MADNKQQVFEILMNNLQTNFLNVKFVLDFMKKSQTFNELLSYTVKCISH